MSDTIKGVKIKELPEKDTMADTDILVVEDSEATKQISAEAMKTYFTADLADEIQKLKNENTELSDNLYKSVEFYNGDTWLETVVVMRGDDAVYTGDEPKSPDGDEYVFTGWEPEPTAVKENIKCYAQYGEITNFAVYCDDDGNLSFYRGVAPEAGTVYNGRIASKVYKNVGNSTSSSSNQPWGSNILSVTFDKSFAEARVTSIAYWFFMESSLTEITGIENLNTSAVKNMGWTFYDCSSLKELDVSGFDTSQTTTMHNLFYYCSSLKELDVSGFDTSKVTDMIYMFFACTDLTTIYSDDNNFVIDNVETSTGMFRYCNSLVGGNGTAYDANKYGYNRYMAHVDTADNPGYFTAK